jgi:hypothetical protein
MKFQFCCLFFSVTLLLTALGCAREVTPVAYVERFQEQTVSPWELLSAHNKRRAEESNAPDILVRKQEGEGDLFTIGLHSCRESLENGEGRFPQSWRSNGSRQLFHGFQEVELFEESPMRENSISISFAQASLAHQQLTLILFAALREGCIQEQIFWSSRQEVGEREKLNHMASKLLYELETIPPWDAPPWREILENSFEGSKK